MDQELLSIVIRESISLFVLLLVLIGGYRLLNRLLGILDGHMQTIEDLVARAVELLEDYTENKAI
jgi:hypothetical protein